MKSLTGAAPNTGGQDQDDPNFAALASLRAGLVAFDRFSETASRQRGCTASMFQLLLAVKTARRAGDTDIGMLATALGVRHPSAAEMVRKAIARDLLATADDPEDGRRVVVRLTTYGEETVAALARAHVEELRRIRGALIASLHWLQD